MTDAGHSRERFCTLSSASDVKIENAEQHASAVAQVLAEVKLFRVEQAAQSARTGRLETEVAALHLSKAALEQRVSTLEVENKRLTGELEAARATIVAKEAEIARLRGAVAASTQRPATTPASPRLSSSPPPPCEPAKKEMLVARPVSEDKRVSPLSSSSLAPLLPPAHAKSDAYTVEIAGDAARARLAGALHNMGEQMKMGGFVDPGTGEAVHELASLVGRFSPPAPERAGAATAPQKSPVRLEQPARTTSPRRGGCFSCCGC